MISLTRRVTFSSGHRYWREDMSREANRELFGQWASPFNHGHNYFLEATIRGRIDPDTGMVINIKWLDELLDKVVVADFDQRSLNDEVPEFKDLTPSIENILRVVEGRLGAMPKGIELERLRLEETPTLWGELELASTEMIKLTRSYEFAASHRLHSPSLTAEENAELFGKCNNEAGHGHNYILEVTVEGVPDPRNGMIVDIGALDEVVNREVVDRYDHKNLNEDIAEFEGKVTTTEAVIQTIWNRLVRNVPAQLIKVRLLETARNIFEVSK